MSKIGIHRPYFDKAYFSGLSLAEAQARYRKLESASKQYLQQMGVPTSLIEKMFSVPSDAMYLLKKNDLQFLEQQPPAYSEWIKAKCDPLTSEENKDYISMGFDVIFGGSPEESGFSHGYAEYLKRKSERAYSCEEQLLEPVRKALLEKYLKQ